MKFHEYKTLWEEVRGTLPANLQGLWNNSNTPPWASGYHADINVEIAYWPAEPANLPECHLPFAEFLWNQRGAWKKATAREKGFQLSSALVRGWTVRYSQNITGGLGWNWYPPGNAWYCQHLWEHYAFTRDREYRKNLAYPTHRHLSHLFALLPGRQTSPITTPELAAAARKSLDAQGEGGEGMAWSAAWNIGLWARLLDGDRPHRMNQSEICHALYDNMCSAGPFQLDGAFGGPAGMCEILLQSHLGQIHLLPALPKSWPTGSAKGLRARSAFEVDISWEDGRLTAARIRSTSGINPEVRYGQQTARLTLDAGKSIAVGADLSVR
jgi:hypothetical protein